MADEWNGLADMLANLIEKYASELDIEKRFEEDILQMMTAKNIINMINVSKPYKKRG